MNNLVSISEAARLINSGAALAIAASTRALSQLPAGNWIAGTSHYFIGVDGGIKTDDQVFITDLGSHGTVTIASYRADEVERISADTPEQGFSVAIVPAGTASLRNFAHRPYSQDMFLKTLVGWVAGVDLAELHTSCAQVVDGRSCCFEKDAVVVAHVTLPAGKMASVSIVNPFQPSRKQALRFETEGFSATHCLIDGERKALVDVLIREGAQDGKRPLVGDYAGANINVSIQAVECVSGRVDFYAPVFPDTDYYLAEPVSNYQGTFRTAIGEREGAPVVFSCNCILNYLYGNLEGTKLGGIYGPVTFGEIAYQLLNQTMVVLEIV